jgi:penicillin-binding protein 1A
MASYSCGGYFKIPSDSDSLSVDSLSHESIPVIDGQPTAEPTPSAPAEAAPTPTPKEPAEATKEE